MLHLRTLPVLRLLRVLAIAVAFLATLTAIEKYVDYEWEDKPTARVALQALETSAANGPVPNAERKKQETEANLTAQWRRVVQWTAGGAACWVLALVLTLLIRKRSHLEPCLYCGHMIPRGSLICPHCQVSLHVRRMPRRLES